MDTLTHGLLGGLTNQIIANRFASTLSRKEVFFVGLVAAMLPDVDFFLQWLDPLRYLADWHRAMTHSLLMLPVWAILVGGIIALIRRKRSLWHVYSLICAVSIFTHICTDLSREFNSLVQQVG